MQEDEIRQKLKPFLDENPNSDIESTQIGGANVFAVKNPWNEASLVIDIPENNPDDIIAVLNNLWLPERLSALYHTDTKSLEILWTSYRLSNNNKEVWERKFDFRYEGKDYKCQFSRASDRTLTLAEATRPVGPSETGWRNVPAFSNYLAAQKTDDEQAKSLFGEPACFWVSEIDLSGDKLVEFLSHLNFYLTYYDRLTPVVLIHPPQSPKPPSATQIRYIHGKFPGSIVTRSIEPEVLSFWTEAHKGQPIDRYLHAYRIIEHAAFFHVSEAAKEAVQKALMAPHALDDVSSTTEAVIAAVQSSRVQDHGKFEYVMRQCVSSDLLWEVIKANLDSFTQTQTFDGGYHLEPLVASANSKSEFDNSGLKNLSGLAKSIRNALSHGREEKSAAVISPTSQNQHKLRPWADLLWRAAGEVVVYRG